MRPLIVCAFISIISMLGACVETPVEYVGVSTERHELRLWVEPHPAISADDVLRGCNLWNPEGVDCVLVADPSVADVRMRVANNPNLCGSTGNLAESLLHGETYLYLNCLQQETGRTGDMPVEHRTLVVAAAHEVGHQLGVAHVTSGPGVMNPQLEHDFEFETEEDHAGYEARDLARSVLDTDDDEPTTSTSSSS